MLAMKRAINKLQGELLRSGEESIFKVLVDVNLLIRSFCISAEEPSIYNRYIKTYPIIKYRYGSIRRRIGSHSRTRSRI